MSNGNEPACPLPFEDEGRARYIGLTKRELFAAMAMQGMAASEFWEENMQADRAGGDSMVREVAHIAVLAADALLAELEKPR